jgi:hypothetical protein
MTQDEEYKTWWHNEGSGILPLPNEDMEEFAHRMTKIAWSNGAFKEREACTKLCEDISNTRANMNAAWRNGCRDVATEIRARS